MARNMIVRFLILFSFTGLALSEHSWALPVNTTPDWKSYQRRDNPSDIMTSPDIAAAVGTKVDAVDGQAQGLRVQGGTQTGSIADSPGATSQTIASTSWVNKWYAPLGSFVLIDTTWTVCASGCTYRDLVVAFKAAMNANFLFGAKVTLFIKDGTYNVSDQLLTFSPKGANVRIIGDIADNSKVILNFNNKANGIGGFTALNGGIIGYIDGLTINGVGGISSETSTQTTWVAGSYGPGIFAGRAGRIITGPHMTINHFYYSELADEGGYISSNGVSGSDAGDVNFLARHNGVLSCVGCTAYRAADNSGATNSENGDLVNLGCNYMAEQGGAIIVTSAKGSWSNIGAVCALSGGSVWADMFTGTGGMGTPTGQGFWAISQGAIQGNHASLTGYVNGAYAGAGGSIQANNATFSNNSASGIVSDGGQFVGTSDLIQNNGQYAVTALHQGVAQIFNSYANMTGNKALSNIEASGTSNGVSYAASSAFIN